MDQDLTCECGKVCISQRGLKLHKSRMHKDKIDVTEVQQLLSDAQSTLEEVKAKEENLARTTLLLETIKEQPEEIEQPKKKKKKDEERKGEH